MEADTRIQAGGALSEALTRLWCWVFGHDVRLWEWRPRWEGDDRGVVTCHRCVRPVGFKRTLLAGFAMFEEIR